MRRLLAIDAGGTSTRAVILSSSGRCLGYGIAGGGNPVSGASEAVYAALSAAVTQALGAATDTSTVLESALLAMAGASAATVTPELTELLGRLGVTGSILIESDLLATFFSGTAHADGYAMVAGTGTVAARIRAGELDRVTDGLGWLLGDAGSGFWIGRRIARAVAAALDGRGPATELTGLLLAEMGIDPGRAGSLQGRPEQLQELLMNVYAFPPVRLARFAPLAFACPQDPVASTIVTAAGDALAGTFAAVHRPEHGDDDLPLVLGGSVAGALWARPGNPLAAVVAGARNVLLARDGTVGAALLALRRCGYPAGREAFDRITKTLAVLR